MRPNPIHRRALPRLLSLAAAFWVAASAPSGAALAAQPSAADPPCLPGLGVGLVDTPTGTVDPRARTYIVDHVHAGAVFSRRFQVCNGLGAPVHVRLYAGAAVIENGSFSVVEGRVDNELSRWITVTPSEANLARGQRLIATALFKVPSDAAPGERYAALLAELPGQRGSGSVTVVDRVGVRVYLDVGNGSAPVSDFTVDSLRAARRADGTAEVLAEVHNIGGRALDMRGTLSLSNGPGGLSAGPYQVQLGTSLAPGQTEPVSVALSPVIRGGPWQAVIDLRSGLLEHKAEAELTFPDQADRSAAPVAARPVPLYRDPNTVGIFAGAAIGLLSLVLATLGLRGYRRRR